MAEFVSGSIKERERESELNFMHIHTPKENHSDSLRNVKRCEGAREGESSA